MIKQANFVKETIWINLAESNRIIKYLTISIQEIIDVISNNVCAEIEISGTKEENATSINRYKVLENCSKLLNEFKSLIEEVEKKRDDFDIERYKYIIKKIFSDIAIFLENDFKFYKTKLNQINETLTQEHGKKDLKIEESSRILADIESKKTEKPEELLQKIIEDNNQRIIDAHWKIQELKNIQEFYQSKVNKIRKILEILYSRKIVEYNEEIIDSDAVLYTILFEFLQKEKNSELWQAPKIWEVHNRNPELWETQEREPSTEEINDFCKKNAESMNIEIIDITREWRKVKISIKKIDDSKKIIDFLRSIERVLGNYNIKVNINLE